MSTTTPSISDYALSESEVYVISDLAELLNSMPVQSYDLKKSIISVVLQAKIILNNPSDCENQTKELYTCMKNLGTCFRNNFANVKVHQYKNYFESLESDSHNEEGIKYNNKRDFYTVVELISDICEWIDDDPFKKSLAICHHILEMFC